ncbi:hypothetical protein PaeBR_16825 [Paenibacillus sp. BR2-3]|uniref:hypothetical protein n=1 Tax=Paenibacillus sp. BR2-3 TaxID=3048494 RepID=UPI0039776928
MDAAICHYRHYPFRKDVKGTADSPQQSVCSHIYTKITENSQAAILMAQRHAGVKSYIEIMAGQKKFLVCFFDHDENESHLKFKK